MITAGRRSAKEKVVRDTGALVAHVYLLCRFPCTVSLSDGIQRRRHVCFLPCSSRVNITTYDLAKVNSCFFEIIVLFSTFIFVSPSALPECTYVYSNKRSSILHPDLTSHQIPQPHNLHHPRLNHTSHPLPQIHHSQPTLPKPPRPHHSKRHRQHPQSTRFSNRP